MNPRITYYANGNKHYEIYYNDLGQLHNEDGLAFIEYYQNGNKSSEQYFINGKTHNIKGPAKIYYNRDSSIQDSFYYLNDNLIDVKTDEEFEKYIKRLNIS